MKNSDRKHPARMVMGRQRRSAGFRARWRQSPELFSDRDDDAAARAELMRDFELALEESLGADRYN